MQNKVSKPNFLSRRENNKESTGFPYPNPIFTSMIDAQQTCCFLVGRSSVAVVAGELAAEGEGEGTAAGSRNRVRGVLEWPLALATSVTTDSAAPSCVSRSETTTSTLSSTQTRTFRYRLTNRNTRQFSNLPLFQKCPNFFSL